MAKRGSSLSQLQRSLYLASRTLGDVQAAQRGRLPQRLMRRSLVRALFRATR